MTCSPGVALVTVNSTDAIPPLNTMWTAKAGWRSLCFRSWSFFWSLLIVMLNDHLQLQIEWATHQREKKDFRQIFLNFTISMC